MAWSAKDLKKLPKSVREQLEGLYEKAVGDSDAERRRAVAKSSEQKALGVERAVEKCLDYADMPMLVRITRVAPRRLDDDNLAGGAKQLRDSIASALGRKGDSERDGLWWEYLQEKGPYELIIEIFQKEV